MDSSNSYFKNPSQLVVQKPNKNLLCNSSKPVAETVVFLIVFMRKGQGNGRKRKRYIIKQRKDWEMKGQGNEKQIAKQQNQQRTHYIIHKPW